MAGPEERFDDEEQILLEEWIGTNACTNSDNQKTSPGGQNYLPFSYRNPQRSCRQAWEPSRTGPEMDIEIC